MKDIAIIGAGFSAATLSYFLKKDFKNGVSYKNGNLILNKDFVWLNKKGPQENLEGLFKKIN